MDNHNSKVSQKNSIIIIITFIILFGLNLTFFFMFKKYALKTDSVLAKLSSIENLLDSNSKEMNTLAPELSRLSKAISEINYKIDLQDDSLGVLIASNEAKNTAIANMIKAKDTLFDRLSLIEIDLDNLKKLNKTE